MFRCALARTAQGVFGCSLTISAKASDEGRLFGSVRRQEIKDALSKEGIAVDRRMIELVEPLKQAGPATVPVHLGDGIVAQLKISIVGANG